MRKLVILTVLSIGVAFPAMAADEDQRELVKMPEAMQQHMMSNMRDHLRALDDVLAALAAGQSRQAGEIAEQRIGMSSLGLHGASHMAPFMPQGMREVGTSLHRASSRFSQAAEEADVQHSYEAQQKVFGALRDITAACNACHASYRLR